jgi:hypothetical protein
MVPRRAATDHPYAGAGGDASGMGRTAGAEAWEIGIATGTTVVGGILALVVGKTGCHPQLC